MSSNLSHMVNVMAQQIRVTNAVEVQPAICPDCQGMGYISFDVEINDPRFGKLFPCPNPNCPTRMEQLVRQANTIMRHSSWSQYDEELTFASFIERMKGQEWKGKRAAYAAAFRFSMGGEPFTLDEASRTAWDNRAWPEFTEFKSKSVVLTGPVGQGKTGLAKAATNTLKGNGHAVIFIRLREFIRRIQETYRSDWNEIGNETAEQRLSRFVNVPYLILDEFAVEKYTDDRLEIVETVIRERDRLGLPFMATTNLTQEEFHDELHWQPRIGDIVDKAHWVSIFGLKLRQTSITANGEW